ncbi:helix-turn-helix domain-containing protein [Streptomyces arboris]|uniref:helix-turn-helix domain-containing protein n=1 Tax=Streptomyces arboris TaxID=2600619 RepID=UPI003BF56302
MRACDEAWLPYGGVSTTAVTPTELNGALVHARYARAAEALHLHVGTVHYRIQRGELLTGRDLARLDHKLGLKAALLRA